MKKLLWACVLALPVLALPTEAKAFCLGNYEIDTGAKVWCNVRQFNCALPTAGPWYLYWPYQAHFQVPAPGVSPFFAQPMGLPPGFGQPPPAAMMPAAAPAYRAPMPTPGQAYYQQGAPPAQGYAPPMPQTQMGYRLPQAYGPTYPVGYYYYGR